MEKKPLYTIGHGRRKAEQLLELLHRYQIQYLIDVRSQPYSRFNPQFNRQALAAFLKANEIQYVFMGDLLGGRPKDVLCYEVDGRINYGIVSTRDFFRKGLERLITAYEKDLSVAIMCSESKPGDCHRTHLISKALLGQSITVSHIDEEGNLKSQEEVLKK